MHSPNACKAEQMSLEGVRVFKLFSLEKNRQRDKSKINLTVCSVELGFTVLE